MNVLALCSGAGGLELGIDLAVPGARAVCYVERDAYAAATLVARMADEALAPAPIWSDVLTFDGEPWRGVVDLISAGFPCQPFSAAGKQRGQEDERWLWDDIVRILRAVRPRWIVLENVPGLVRLGLGPVLRDLAVLGYDAEWDLFSAASVGAPHKRERFFLLARRVSDPDRDNVWTEQGGGESRGAGTTQLGDMGNNMADPDCSRCGWREDHGAGRKDAGTRSWGVESERGHSDMADPDCSRRTPTGCRHGEHAGCQPQPGSGDMADPGSEGLQGSERISRGAREGARTRTDGSVTELRYPCMADPDCWGCERNHGQRLPLFPPGPSDHDLWARVLTEAPTLEPSFCGVADGMADRLEFRADRLRTIGNGVVPLQAAYAIRTLAARAGWRLT